MTLEEVETFLFLSGWEKRSGSAGRPLGGILWHRYDGVMFYSMEQAYIYEIKENDAQNYDGIIPN